MIFFLVCRGYEFTVSDLQDDSEAPRIAILPYGKALHQSAVPRATYVFTDLDRLDVSELIAAARLFQRLKENGCRVLNDPARVRTRFSLLRSLYRHELNPLNVYSLEDGEVPERFPVFIRIAEEHTAGPLTDLIGDQQELDRAIDAVLAAGYPRRALIITEYAAAPARPGIFRKLSVFRVADRYLPHVCVHDSNWIVKRGKPGIAPMDLYDEELEILQTNPFAGAMKAVFENAEIDYGRVDFGLVDDRPCVYEINTNPTLSGPYPHSVPQRVESMKIGWQALLSALTAIDDEPGDPTSQVDVSGESVTALSQALKIHPSLSDGFLRLSKEHARRGDFRAAIQCAEEGTVQAPDDAKLVTLLGQLMVEQGRLPDAINLAKRAAELDPKDPEISVQSVKVLLAAKDGNEALAAAQRAMSARPKDGRLTARFARLMAANDHLEEAIEYAHRAVELGPDDPEFSSLTAGLLLEAGRGEEALKAVQRAISLQPKKAEYHLLLGQIQSVRGNVRAALAAAKRSIALSSKEDKPAATQRVRAFRVRLTKQQVRNVVQHLRRMLHIGGRVS